MTKGDKTLIAVGSASAAIGLAYLVYLIVKSVKERKVYVESFDEAIENHKKREPEKVEEHKEIEEKPKEEVKSTTPLVESVHEVEVEPVDLDIELIEYDDFETEDGFEVFDFSIYSDGIVADNMNNDAIIENPEKIIGEEALRYLEYSDSAYVKNNLLKAYYEITKVDDTYETITGRKPVKKRSYKKSNGTKKKADGAASTES